MDASEALDDLIGLSAEIEHAAILDAEGAVLAATAAADGERLSRVAAELLDVAEVIDPARTVDSVLVEVAAGAVLVVRADGCVAAATTGPQPTSALVLHDLRVCLERIDRRPATASRRKRKAEPVDA